MILNSIIGFSIKNKLIIGLLTLGLIIYGIYELTRLPIDAVPDITNNQVQVITVAPSLGASDIERLVTFPVEQANSNIPGMHEIRSFSRFGLSLVTIVFDDNVDVYWARQQVTERLQSVISRIPPGVGVPELGPVTTGLGEIYQYVVRPVKGYESRYNSTDLRTIQDWVIRRQLLGVQGVADVSSFGGNLKQYEIAVDPDKLQALNVSISEIFHAVETNNSNTGGAYIEKGPAVLYIRTEGLVSSVEEIGLIPVKKLENGVSLLIRDVAEVKLGKAVRYGALHYNTDGEVAGAVVMMIKGGNSSEIIRNVKERVSQIQKTLPEGVVIEPFLDRSKMVKNAIGTVEKNLLEGALIVVFVLVMFLGNFRAGILVASVIPLSMLFAVILMNTFGVSGNLMSLGALDFGLIVDGAVIIVEAVMHALSRDSLKEAGIKLNRNVMDETVKKSASKMMNSAVFGQIIILIVYLPIFALEGIEGKMFRPMAQTVAFALIGAFVLSLTYIPMMSSLFLSRKLHVDKNFSDRMMGRIEDFYLRVLKLAINYKKILLGSVVVLFVLSLIVLSRLGGEFIPSLEEGDFALETRVLPGSNLNVSIKAAKQASAILLDQFPEVEKVVSKIGSGEVPTDPMPIDAQDLMIILKDKKEWTSAKSFGELAEKMGKALEDVPGVSFGFQYPVQMRFNELMTGARQDVVCKIFGENLDTLAYYAAKLGNIASGVNGAEDIYVEPVAGIPQIVISYKRDQVARYGLSIEDINRVVNSAFAGSRAGTVYEGEKRFDLLIRLRETQRQELSDVRNLLIPVSKDINLPLYHLADVEIKDGPNQIQREDAKRRIVVGFNVRGRDVKSIVNELQEKTGKELNLPAAYYVSYGGAFENLNAAVDRLSIAVPVALVLIFLMLYFAFHSAVQAMLIFTAIPLSAIGGIFALYIRSMPFSISAGIGFIALFGVAVLNGIVLIAEFKRLSSEAHTDIYDIVIKGSVSRLRPVLITALVASLGFLPMALSHGAGAEVQRPLATVVIGGLLIATLLTLFVLPVIFCIAENKFKLKINMKKTLAILLLFGLSYNGIRAQQLITLEDALDSAVSRNPELDNERLLLAYRDASVNTAYNLPRTSVLFDYGMINSSFNDKRFTISQNLQFPLIYSKQKRYMQSLKYSEEKKFVLSTMMLRREVCNIYYRIQYLSEKVELLKKADSIFAASLQRSKILFTGGETGKLEYTLAELQRNQIEIQLREAITEREIEINAFRVLMNTNNTYLPVQGLTRLSMPDADSSYLSNHPQLLYLKQELVKSEADLALSRTKLLPDLQFSYSDMSMQGVGADNKAYGAGFRFRSLQFGIGIPLFAGSQLASVKASGINRNMAEGNYKVGEIMLAKQWNELSSRLNYFKTTVDYYDSSGLKAATELVSIADIRLRSGEISYTEWVVLNNQSLAVQSHYLDIVKQLNETIIELIFMMGESKI